MIAIDWNPECKKLRQFAVVWVIAFTVLALVTAFRLGCFNGSGRWLAPAILAGLSLAGLPGVLIPAAARPGYLLLTAISWPIGIVVSHVLIAFVYFGLFTPLAIVFRLIGRDALCRRFDSAAGSYFIDHPGPAPADRYFRQF